MSIEDKIAVLRAAGTRRADFNQHAAVAELASMASVQAVLVRKVEEERDGLAVEVERLKEALSPSAVRLAERVRGLGLEDLADEIELLGDGRTEEQFRADCNGCPALDESIKTIDDMTANLWGALGCQGEDPPVALTMVVAQELQLTRDELAAVKRERDELKDGCDRKLREIRAVADALTREPSVRQVGHTLLGILDGAPPCRIGGVDWGVGPDQTVEQNWITFSCPAGCEHRVLLPEDASIEESGNAITAQTGLTAWKTAGGELVWDRHQAQVCSVALGEPVKTAAEYSADITDPLATAREEFDLIIGLDGDKAWLSGTPTPAGGERDQYVSALETFMAATLKWAQGTEQRRVDAMTLLHPSSGGWRRHDEAAAAVAILTGLGKLDQDPPRADPPTGPPPLLVELGSSTKPNHSKGD